ncbi:MAG: hypothetical protein N5P05_002611 [Chroococcopsis gigantea SAG 12.99]|jgi:predicted nuclease of predicted toxin-antitoxin system|nr:DUF5615 family PIN-like protein [Chlorogloea purpurea SAG 13.99]MDV3001005.1 hypothetical protein [Chroococcopsis gigantea SAG 12.99]
MKFLIDAQLPVRLARFLQDSGYDTVHTKDLPEQNSTSDNQINKISIEQERVVITKDSDFVDSFITSQKPYKLLLVSTGNIKNKELETLFAKGLPTIVDSLEKYKYIELTRDEIIVHQ